MKHKRTLSAFLALFIAVVVCAEPCLLPKAASAERISPADTVSVDNSGMTIEGTNSFGDLFAAELSDKQQEQLANNGYQIYSVEMDGATATVDFQVPQDCTLVVGIYEEDKVTLLGTGTAEVTPGQGVAEIDISVSEMPQYFYVKGYLCDTSSLEPLCVVYENPNYTQEMQEFFSMTTDDFDAERVLNFDGDKTNNFAVYDENTIVIPENEGYNIVTSVDGENAVYVIENADEHFLSLQEGDIFAYRYGENGLIIAKAAAIEINGTTVTITGAEISMRDAFEFVRIEQEQGTDEAIISGFTFEDDTPSEASARDFDTIADDEQPSGGTGLDVEGNVTFEGDTIKGDATIHAMISKDFEFDSTKYSKSDKVFKIKGNFNADEITAFNLYCKYYVHKDDQYVEIKLDYSAKLTIDTEIDMTASIPLPSVTFVPCPGVHLTFSPTFEVNGNVKTHLEDTLTGAIGFRASTRTGIADLSESPVFHSEIDVEGELYIGLSFESNISLGSEKIDKVTLTGGGGVQLKAEYHFDTSVDLSTGETIPDGEASILHPEGGCFHGYVMAKFRIKASVSFLNSKKWLKFDLPKDGEKTAEITLSHFYRCDCGQTGSAFLGTMVDGLCPHNIFRATIYVEDSERNPIPNAKISANVEDAMLNEEAQPVTKTTDEKGAATYFIRPFTLDQSSSVIYTISANGYQSAELKISAAEIIGLYALFYKDYLLGHNPQSLLDTFSHKTVTLEKWNTAPDDTPTGAQKVTQVSLGVAHSAAITEDGSLYMWGWNAYAQLGNGTTEDSSVPVKIMDNVKLVSLSARSAAITEDGRLYMWGSNDEGQLGNGTTEDSSTPIKIMDNVKSVSLGNHHSAAITEDGSLYTWGYNNDKQLGNGTTEDSSVPIKIMDNVKSVSLGWEHSAAITEDGSLYTWGRNGKGQLGNGTTEDSSTPIKIMENVKSVSLGWYHCAAITEDGSLYMWGNNYFGQLGNGTTKKSSTPIKIMDNVKSVSLGDYHSAAITEDGGLYTWGHNNNDQLGNGESGGSYDDYDDGIDSNIPIKILDNVQSVSLGVEYSAAITEGGSLYTWGRNDDGQLGNGTTEDSSVPVKVEIPAESPAQIQNAEAVAILSSSLTELLPNTLYNYYALFSEDTEPLLTAENLCYITQFVTDSNGAAKIDTGETYIPEGAVIRMVPVEVTDEQSDPPATDSTTETTTTTTATETTTTTTETTTSTTEFTTAAPQKPTTEAPVETITTTTSTETTTPTETTASTTEFTTAAPQKPTTEAPVETTTTTTTKTTTSTTRTTTAASESTTSSTDTTTTGSTQTQPGDSGELSGKKIKQVSLGANISAALMENGELYMWGSNYYGSLGNGVSGGTSSEYDIGIDSYVPIKVMDNIKAVCLGDSHSAAITEDGSLYLWGNNLYGQLGDGTTENSATPVKIMDDVKAVSLGYQNSAAITEDGSLYVWGDNSWGQLGNGSTQGSSVPVKIMDNVKSVSLGNSHSAAVTFDGSLYLWGNNDYGQLGNGTSFAYNKPTKIMDEVAAVSLGGEHSAAIALDGTLYAWGRNEDGQLGIGSDEVYVAYPTPVLDDVVSVSLSRGSHSAAITGDGELWMWGGNWYGQLGNGNSGGVKDSWDSADSTVPIKIMDGIIACALGYSHSAAITENGNLLTWGFNERGALGNGTLENSSLPKEAIFDVEPQTTTTTTATETTTLPTEGTTTTTSTETTTTTAEQTTTTLSTESTTTSTDATTQTTPSETMAFGDVDNSGNITIDDATMTLQVYTNQMLHVDAGVTDDVMKAMDLDEDGAVTIDDATYILAYYTAESVTHTPMTWYEITGNPNAPGAPE